MRMVTPRFNEAAGIHRRKPELGLTIQDGGTQASMRPPEFTGGNSRPPRTRCHHGPSFNEAAGIHRRKLEGNVVATGGPERFNEAAGIHRRKPTPCVPCGAMTQACFNEAAGIHRRKLAWMLRKDFAPSTLQ